MFVSQPMLSVQETLDYLDRHGKKSLLQLVTCGSVDDGKSTLIGRLLLETGAVYEDQLEALRADSQRHGTTGDEIDPALLLDGLEDERQQGITIDVAYRYLQTSKRKLIVADSPGHEQYTRNMATAASNADLAIILVDARKGVLPQTKRHSFIVSLLGVHHVVVAVNKMDLVDFSQDVFDRICEDYRTFASQLDIPKWYFVPISGLKGDNVSASSEQMTWYQGPSLLDVLEQAERPRLNNIGTRFPVQRVVRPNSEFRGYAGTLNAGTISVGDEIQVLPSGKVSRVRSLITFDRELQTASAVTPLTVTLQDEIDISRGDMLVDPGQPPRVTRHFDASIVWMSQHPLVPGKEYWLKQANRRTVAEIEQVEFRTEVNTLEKVQAAKLELNEIGFCRVSTREPLVLDAYRESRKTGAFILVDRVSHETVAAGMIADASDHETSGDDWSERTGQGRLQLANSEIAAADRAQRIGHSPLTVLITGLSGSGKTTIAYALEKRLFSSGLVPTVLDGQNLRLGISRDLGFSAEERSENLRRAAEIAKTINDAGLICIAAFVAPDAAIRQKVRDLIGGDRFLHVHLDVSVDTCRKRDRSGRYRAADRGEIVNFPGVTADYPTPEDCDLILSTEQIDVEACVDRIQELIEAFLRKPVNPETH